MVNSVAFRSKAGGGVARLLLANVGLVLDRRGEPLTDEDQIAVLQGEDGSLFGIQDHVLLENYDVVVTPTTA